MSDWYPDEPEHHREGGHGGHGGRRGGGRGVPRADQPSRPGRSPRARAPRAARTRSAGLLAGRITAAAMSAVVVLAAGVVWFENKQLTDGLHTSDSINQIKPGDDGYVAPHLGHDVNLLLIGLDSRKDMNGNDLPTSLVENELHAGSSKIGGYNTNVLILMHIPANGGKVTAFSIPRDDYVDRPGGSATIPGVGTVQVPDPGMGKIKEAYGKAKEFAESKIVASGETDKAKIEAESREVGRQATLRAVQKLTGVHVDHLAEVNLLGFYDIVKAIGPVQVCLRAPAYDPIENGAGTGLNLPAGVSTIDAATALQFVRQRYHLTNGDLDRTHRQQAFLSSVTRKLKQQGVLNDIGSMQSLFNVVKKDVVIDDGWSVLDFASQASNLTGGNTEFNTLPIKVTADVPDAPGSKTLTSVNLVDPAAIKATVTAAFSDDAAVAPPPASASSKPTTPTTPTAPKAPPTTPTPPADISVLNGTSSTGLAVKVSGVLFDGGIPVSKTGNADNVRHTVIRYGAGEKALAEQIQAKLGTSEAPIAGSSVPKGSIVVTLGSDYRLPTTTSTPQSPRSSGQPSSTASSDKDSSGLSAGGPVDMSSSKDGIPCVY